MTLFGKLVLGGLVLVIGGAIFFSVTSGVQNDSAAVPVVAAIPEETTTATSTATATTTATTTPEKPAGKKMAFSEFMKQGGSYQCDVTQTVATMTTSGKVYIHDKLVSGKFSVSVAGQTVETNMIMRDGFSYTWTNLGKNTGIKTKVDAPATGGTAPSTMTWTGAQIGDYNCEPWTADDTKFEIPTTITFTTA